MVGILVHEWIEESGGAENVLDGFVRAFPESEIYCLWNDAPARYPDSDVRESVIARSPLRGRKALALPFMLPLWRRVKEDENLDWALISSHLFAHHVSFRGQPGVKKFAYVHTPARYIWTPELDMRGNSPIVNAVRPILKKIDRKRAQELHAIAGNSEFVRERIYQTWGRDADVIYPPVDTARIQQVPDWVAALDESDRKLLDSLPEGFALGASRLVRYKSLDAVIDFARANDVPAVIAGDGPDRQRLEEYAGGRSDVHFIGAPSSELLYALYQRSLAYIFPPVEDFGIMPVEAMAAGARVVVNAIGGASESVQDGVSGVHTGRFSGEDATEALGRVMAVDESAARERARDFSNERFVEEIRSWVAGA